MILEQQNKSQTISNLAPAALLAQEPMLTVRLKSEEQQSGSSSDRRLGPCMSVWH